MGVLDIKRSWILWVGSTSLVVLPPLCNVFCSAVVKTNVPLCPETSFKSVFIVTVYIFVNHERGEHSSYMVRFSLTITKRGASNLPPVSFKSSHSRMSKSYSPSKEKMTSHGRGGAGNLPSSLLLHHPPNLPLHTGNIASSSSTPKPEDLATPTIKTETYTTGRGGAGNMAKNDPSNPELARESQDVTAPVRTVSPEQSHYGRGR